MIIDSTRAGNTAGKTVAYNCRHTCVHYCAHYSVCEAVTIRLKTRVDPEEISRQETHTRRCYSIIFYPFFSPLFSLYLFTLAE